MQNYSEAKLPLKFKEAIKLASEAHKGQKRKFDGKPYLTHPLRVAKLVEKFKGQSKNIEALKIAAVLHDTIEDGDIKPMQIKKMFGNMVMAIVRELTSDDDKVKKEGKANYLSNKLTNDLTDYALVLKLADRLDNVSDIKIASPEFREKYTKETNQIIAKLEAERELTQTQKNIIAEIKRSLV
jgi:(p)ppGpp synthase/HD superfamily hydrolase